MKLKNLTGIEERIDLIRDILRNYQTSEPQIHEWKQSIGEIYQEDAVLGINRGIKYYSLPPAKKCDKLYKDLKKFLQFNRKHKRYGSYLEADFDLLKPIKFARDYLKLLENPEMGFGWLEQQTGSFGSGPLMDNLFHYWSSKTEDSIYSGSHVFFPHRCSLELLRHPEIFELSGLELTPELPPKERYGEFAALRADFHNKVVGSYLGLWEESNPLLPQPKDFLWVLAMQATYAENFGKPIRDVRGRMKNVWNTKKEFLYHIEGGRSCLCNENIAGEFNNRLEE